MLIRELARIHHLRVARLRDLSIEVEELSAWQAREAMEQFARAFLGPGREGPFLREVEAARASRREVDYGRWLFEGAPPPELKPRFGWLSDWYPGRTCVRFDRRVAFPALRLVTYRMLDEWALSWPGAYVSFETWRAMVVSLDYEVTCYELAAPRKPPYR